ncbi:MAG TPA: hypothetical protein VHN79_02000, partial [Lacunisphaera sp.]|nr:hypothetical protein [Lacunisphaera sp.]
MIRSEYRTHHQAAPNDHATAAAHQATRPRHARQRAAPEFARQSCQNQTSVQANAGRRKAIS